ncbi:RNA methyltransferase substrate-binding domain-containing protein, partial [Micromonospora aurantiaca (nom. illeg.)]|uniref:RNA methyltransferase substrate-binding domain-containing protein n=1 Tax=Micromonospora aurantiaca (nom. illeg.) TaxID=47850 RepID=UPI003802B50B
MQSQSQGRRLDAVPGPFTPRTPRVVAARRLQRRRDRDQAGRFLAEGPQAVREALARTGTVVELFGTPAALDRYADLAAAAARADVPVSEVTDDALAALTETVAPQGLVFRSETEPFEANLLVL